MPMMNVTSETALLPREEEGARSSRAATLPEGTDTVSNSHAMSLNKASGREEVTGSASSGRRRAPVRPPGHLYVYIRKKGIARPTSTAHRANQQTACPARRPATRRKKDKALFANLGREEKQRENSI